MADQFLRQRVLAGFGSQGQDALGRANVAVVGVGGLGCPAALYLATSGVGRLTLIDDDAVAVSNLHRQVLFGPDSVGRAKVDSAAAQLRSLAPWCDVTPVHARLTSANGDGLLAGHDLVLDCTDGWISRRDTAAVARGLDVPVVWGAAVGWFGQATVFGARVGLEDVFPGGADLDLDTCEGQGVAAVTCGLVGTAMAALAVGALLRPGSGEGTLRHLDARTAAWREVSVGGRIDA